MYNLKVYFTFNLTKPLTAHNKGEIEEFTELLIKAPSNRVQLHIVKMRQGWTRATMDLISLQKDIESFKKSDSAEPVVETEPSGEDCMNVLFGSSIDMEEYCNNFKALLFKKDICLIQPSGTPLQPHQYDDMTPDDTMRLLGEYLKHFLV